MLFAKTYWGIQPAVIEASSSWLQLARWRAQDRLEQRVIGSSSKNGDRFNGSSCLFLSSVQHSQRQSICRSRKSRQGLPSQNGSNDRNHPFNVEVLINPGYWSVRNSDDDLLTSPNESVVEMKFVFASNLDESNYVRSRGVGQKLLVKVNRNDAGRPHFDAARQTRNAILASLNVPFTASEGMGYGNEGTVHRAGEHCV